MSFFFQELVNGLTVGALYSLVALGFSMVYGVLKLLNFAHGDLYMVGAFTGYFVIQWFGGPQATHHSRSAAAGHHVRAGGAAHRRHWAWRSSGSPTGRCATRRGSRR